MSVNLYRTALRQIPEERDVHATALFLTFPISKPLENIQDVNFKILPVFILFKCWASITVKFFDTIRISIPSFFFLIKLVKILEEDNPLCY